MPLRVAMLSVQQTSPGALHLNWARHRVGRRRQPCASLAAGGVATGSGVVALAAAQRPDVAFCSAATFLQRCWPSWSPRRRLCRAAQR